MLLDLSSKGKKNNGTRNPDLGAHFQGDQGTAGTAGQGNRRQEGPPHRVRAPVSPSRSPGIARRRPRPAAHRADAALVRAAGGTAPLPRGTFEAAPGPHAWPSRVG